jgi:fumarylpyruvate hydrolase
MTRRDLQRALGDEKKPWEIGKSFDMSAPIGPLHRVSQIGHIGKAGISLISSSAVKKLLLTAQFNTILPVRITFAHLAISVATRACAASGVPPRVVIPNVASFSIIAAC